METSAEAVRSGRAACVMCGKQTLMSRERERQRERDRERETDRERGRHRERLTERELEPELEFENFILQGL